MRCTNFKTSSGESSSSDMPMISKRCHIALQGNQRGDLVTTGRAPGGQKFREHRLAFQSAWKEAFR